MRRVRSRLTILLLILVIVTSLFSLTFGALVRNGIIFQQRDNIRYLVFGYAAKDILLLLIAVAAVAVLITVTSRSTTNPIRELSRAAREIAGGNYDVTVPERDRVEEFGELERNFNLMTAELRSNEYLRKDFISSVSHQLKTPLSILNGYAQLLAEGGLSETEEREYSQYIAQESDRLVGLIDDMLRLSRIDHREIHRKAEIFPLGEQLRRAVLQLEPRWTEAGLSVSADIPDLDYVGDSELLYQVWVNLLENAVKFTPPGGRIGICLAAAADTVTVTVWDTGCGMDKETMQHIFEPFFTTKKTGEGTGLGLALADQIIRTHRGRIRAESTIGRGTTFYVYLPVLEQQQEREQLQWGVDSKLRILAADDNNKVLDLLDKDLSALGLSVSTCSRRGELRQLLEQQPFDVLAIDESLMSSSGVDFCMAIRGRYPGMTRIVMTNAPTREIVDARSHGVIDGYVVKPVSASTLLAQIRSSRKE